MAGEFNILYLSHVKWYQEGERFHSNGNCVFGSKKTKEAQGTSFILPFQDVVIEQDARIVLKDVEIWPDVMRPRNDGSQRRSFKSERIF